MSTPFLYPYERWEPWRSPAVRDGRGPERVVTDAPDPDFQPRPAGFVATPPARPDMPLLWEGDQA